MLRLLCSLPLYHEYRSNDGCCVLWKATTSALTPPDCSTSFLRPLLSLAGSFTMGHFSELLLLFRHNLQYLTWSDVGMHVVYPRGPCFVVHFEFSSSLEVAFFKTFRFSFYFYKTILDVTDNLTMISHFVSSRPSLLYPCTEPAA